MFTMAKHNETGKKGEDMACAFLLSLHYKILERNYRYKRNEVDIICLDRNLLVFVEVKTRTSKAYGNPEDFLSKAQMKRIAQTAQFYLEENSFDNELRFDIIAISKNNELEHIKDAFFPIDGVL